MKKILSLIIIFSFPLREAVGINIGLPIRIGELFMYIYALYTIVTIFKNKIFKEGFFYKKALLLVVALAVNLIMCIIVSTNFQVNNDFLIKYIFRNTCILVFIFSVMVNPIEINQKLIETFFKYIIVIELIFCLIQIMGKDLYFLNFIDYNPERYLGLIRLKGTASEPGYLPVVVAPALYYFRNNIDKKIYYYLGMLILFFTFSSFAYVIIGFELILYIKSTLYKKINIKKIIICLISLSIVIGVVYGLNTSLKDTNIKNIIEFNTKKITGFISNNEVDYSSQSRSQQIKLALQKFNDFSTLNKLLGKGTGAYSLYMKTVGNNMVLEQADEAHNLYVSTLYDRGILGEFILIILIVLILTLSSKNKKTMLTKCMKYSIFIQILHWTLTGNLWLYYFWIAVGILLSSDIYSIKNLSTK